MQGSDWDDLKFVLTLDRAGTLAGAGRALGADETTVARRVKALERSLRTSLFMRSGTGRYVATEVGSAVIEKAERIEREIAAIGEAVGYFANRLFGVVRITSVPMVVNRVLVKRLSAFRAAHPGVTIELVPDSRNLSLSKREADLALRLARPEVGGLGTKVRKIGRLVFSIYCPAPVPNENVDGLEWIAYDDAHAHLPQARWLATVRRQDGSDSPCLRVSDAETAHEAVAAGLGKTILPRIVADSDPRLRRLCGTGFTGLPSRDVWLLSHVNQDHSVSVRAAKEWLTAIDWSSGG